MPDLDPHQVRLFFQTARERQRIFMRRSAGLPREQWTHDPIFRDYHFCNVFRCNDRVSQAILNLASVWEDPWTAALAGRLINRHGTIKQLMHFRPPVEPAELRELIGSFGLNTNAYRLNTPLGLNNLDGVVLMYSRGLPLGPEVLSRRTMPDALASIRKAIMGNFIGYQIMLDLMELRALPADFVDEKAWPGMGAERGALRILGQPVPAHWNRRKNYPSDHAVVEDVMARLLELSRNPLNWPAVWRPWTIHEVEGWLCEYDKWARRANNESQGGRKFKAPYQPGSNRS